MIKAQFDRLYEEGAESGTVMCMPLHPFLIGQPHRIGAFDDALAYITAHDGVWVTTGREIADWYFEHYYDAFSKWRRPARREAGDGCRDPTTSAIPRAGAASTTTGSGTRTCSGQADRLARQGACRTVGRGRRSDSFRSTWAEAVRAAGRRRSAIPSYWNYTHRATANGSASIA